MLEKPNSKNAYDFQTTLKLNFLKSAKEALSEDLFDEYIQLSEAKTSDKSTVKLILQQKIRQLSLAKILTSSYDHDRELLIESHIQLAQAYADNQHHEQAYEHYKEASDKLNLIDNDSKTNKEIKIMICEELVSTSFKLKNYHQTLGYISEFDSYYQNNDESATGITSTRFFIDGIKARVLYELGDTLEAEKILNDNLQLIESGKEINMRHNDGVDSSISSFMDKIEIYNFLYKIYKNDKNYPKILDILKRNIGHIEGVLKEYPDRFVFKFERVKTYTRKINFLQKNSELINNIGLNSSFKRLDELIDDLAKHFEDLCKNNHNELFTKHNHRFLSKIKTTFTNEFIAQIKTKDYQRAIQVIEVLRYLNRYIDGDNSLEHAKTLYLCVKCMIKNRGDRNSIYKYCKKILKICKQIDNEELFSKTRQLMTSEIDNAVVDISLTEINNC